jgi:hypothetical protein
MGSSNRERFEGCQHDLDQFAPAFSNKSVPLDDDICKVEKQYLSKIDKYIPRVPPRTRRAEMTSGIFHKA